tara:strand:- start:68 stop:268 length:201 start_codon:yes stop_codon:yes gene_type:complete
MKLLSPQKNIHLYAAESLIESIEKRTFVEIVVVGMGAKQGRRRSRRSFRLFSARGDRHHTHKERHQ